MRQRAGDRCGCIFPAQGGHFPEQQRSKPLGGAALCWKFRPKAARDTSERVSHGFAASAKLPSTTPIIGGR